MSPTSIDRAPTSNALPQQNESCLVAFASIIDLSSVGLGVHHASTFQFFLHGLLEVQGHGIAKLGT